MTPTEKQKCIAEPDNAEHGCGDCIHFLYEDTDGYGICEIDNVTQQCSDNACNTWNEV